MITFCDIDRGTVPLKGEISGIALSLILCRVIPQLDLVEVLSSA